MTKLRLVINSQLVRYAHKLACLLTSSFDFISWRSKCEERSDEQMNVVHHRHSPRS